MVSNETKRRISESLKGRIAWNKGKPHSAETRAKISAKAKIRFQNSESHPFYGRHHSEETKQKISEQKKHYYSTHPNPFLGHYHTLETKEKIRQKALGRPSLNKGRPKSEETKRKLSLALLGNPRSEASRLKQSKTYKLLWANSEYRERIGKLISEGIHQRPNKPEQQLIDIIERERFPFLYTGDGSFTIHGFRPDFVQCNGKKQIIELFGDYWHNNENIVWHQTELGRIMAYNQFGYKTLIIWEHELQDEPKVIEKIKLFMGKH